MDFLSVDFPAWLASRKTSWRKYRKRRKTSNYLVEVVGECSPIFADKCAVLRRVVEQQQTIAKFLRRNDPFPGWTKEVITPVNASGSPQKKSMLQYLSPDGSRRLRSRREVEEYGLRYNWSEASVSGFDFQPVFCICHLPEDDGDYVECCIALGGCNGWFHPKCVGWERPLEQIRALDAPVVCPLCSTLLEVRNDTDHFEGKIPQKPKKEKKQWDFAPGSEFEYYNDDASSSLTSTTPSSLQTETDEDTSSALLELVQYVNRTHRIWGIPGTPHCWINTHTPKRPRKPDIERFFPPQLPNPRAFPPPILAEMHTLPQPMLQQYQHDEFSGTQATEAYAGENTSYDSTISLMSSPILTSPPTSKKKRPPSKRQRVDSSHPIAILEDGSSIRVKLAGGWMRRGENVVVQEQLALQSKLISHEVGLHLTTQYRMKLTQRAYNIAVTGKSSIALQKTVLVKGSYVPMVLPLPSIDGPLMYTCISMNPKLGFLRDHCVSHCAYCFQPLQSPGSTRLSRSLHTIFDGPHSYRIHNNCFIALAGCYIALDTDVLSLCHVHDDSNDPDASCDICGRVGAILQYFRIIHSSGVSRRPPKGDMWLGHPYCIRWLLRCGILRVIQKGEEEIRGDDFDIDEGNAVDRNDMHEIVALIEDMTKNIEGKVNSIDRELTESISVTGGECSDNLSCEMENDVSFDEKRSDEEIIMMKETKEHELKNDITNMREDICSAVTSGVSAPIKVVYNLFDAHFDQWRCSICGNRTGLTLKCIGEVCSVRAHPLCALLEKWRLLKNFYDGGDFSMLTAGMECPMHSSERVKE